MAKKKHKHKISLEGIDRQRNAAKEAIKPLARKLLAQGWGRDGVILILSDAMFELEGSDDF